MPVDESVWFYDDELVSPVEGSGRVLTIDMRESRVIRSRLVLRSCNGCGKLFALGKIFRDWCSAGRKEKDQEFEQFVFYNS